ncbi:hypothetical protein PTSG_10787 [Salpingoeca rosetta]|uniref:t-SNARE coiled-coil homology domain-containing protein n=1 Tax=Salpingoeca rosetta (strain ATCC 50818 / BSB-021) TaxID=946362 RepID=F2UPX4_SALR5|nr:uncharacterized protein PTSG_10787 [Salpingoeca rosetta]EGD79804.1 hypothetical protein PTSG_10787 [Salpingoeca rosetta]|eukprot:XP_004988753.1 hypothetical protein PTSG_10787 [Salpingoeca rosetta]
MPVNEVLSGAFALVHKANTQKGHAVKLIERCERILASQTPHKLLGIALQVDNAIQDYGRTCKDAETALIQLKKDRPEGVSDAQLRKLREEIKGLHDDLADMKRRLIQVDRERRRLLEEEQAQQQQQQQQEGTDGQSGAGDAGMRQQQQQQQQQQQPFRQEQWQETRRKLVEEQTQFVQQREKGVQQLHQDMQDIHSILQNMAEEVTTQGQQLPSTKSNAP